MEIFHSHRPHGNALLSGLFLGAWLSPLPCPPGPARAGLSLNHPQHQEPVTLALGHGHHLHQAQHLHHQCVTASTGVWTKLPHEAIQNEGPKIDVFKALLPPWGFSKEDGFHRRAGAPWSQHLCSRARSQRGSVRVRCPRGPNPSLSVVCTEPGTAVSPAPDASMRHIT